MSIVTDELKERLVFGVPDRLGKALEVADVSSNEMAEYLGVSRTTVSNYLNGRTAPKLAILRLWAVRTGVPLPWIETGIFPSDRPRGGGQDGRVVRFLPPRESRLWESNPRPSHYE